MPTVRTAFSHSLEWDPQSVGVVVNMRRGCALVANVLSEHWAVVGDHTTHLAIGGLRSKLAPYVANGADQYFVSVFAAITPLQS